MIDQWDCFISYPSAQREVASELADLLVGSIRVFLDKRVLRPGDHWPTELKEALSASYVAAIVVAPETERAFYEQEEIVQALDQSRDLGADRRVVPIFVDGMTSDDTRVPFGLRSRQGFVIESARDLAYAADGIITLASELRERVRMEFDPDSEPREISPTIRQHLARLHIEADQLTREQYRAINQLRHMRRVRISGSAGSGKTLVAAEKATRLARAGINVLFLCHNPLLADHVAQLTAGTGVAVRDFAQWLTDLLGLGRDDGQWTHHSEPEQPILDLAFERLTDGTGRVDAIVVDEGQDFRSEWWTLIEAALTGSANGSLYIFHDNNQSLLAYRGEYPILEPHVDLSRNCRNAGRVLELMRCFDSSAPEPELGLRSPGTARVTRFDSGQEATALTKALIYLEQQQLLEDSVVLLTADQPLETSIFNGMTCLIPTIGAWQDEIRGQFGKALHLYTSHGVTPPAGGEKWVAAELQTLSTEPYPTAGDVECVRRITQAFGISRDVRAHIHESPAKRQSWSWKLDGRSPRLWRRGSGPIWAAEVLLHLNRQDWERGLPKPKAITLHPFDSPRTKESVPLYRVSDFKGLESEAVVLIIRGRVTNHREATYVGVSRARACLYVLVDQGGLSILPRSFVWDS